MASTNGIIYQALIQSNCQTFLKGDVEVDVVTQLDSKGKWKVHVLKTEHGTRSALLTGSAPSLQGAFEDLHKKSAKAVDQYVSANGFNPVPEDWTKPSRRGRNKRSHVSPDASLDSLPTRVVDDSGSSSSSGSDKSDSDDDSSVDLTPGSKDWPGWTMGHTPALNSKRKTVVEILDRRPGQFPSLPPLVPPPGRTLPGNVTVTPMAVRPSPRPKSRVPPPPGANYRGIARPQPPPMIRQTAPQQAVQPPPGWPLRMCNVLLSISWIGHGKTTLLDECPLSLRAIQERAAQIVRTNSHEFTNVTPMDLAPSCLASMRVTVKRLQSGDETYILANCPDDLSGLCVESPQFLRIEVEARSGNGRLPPVYGSGPGYVSD